MQLLHGRKEKSVETCRLNSSTTLSPTPAKRYKKKVFFMEMIGIIKNDKDLPMIIIFTVGCIKPIVTDDNT